MPLRFLSELLTFMDFVREERAPGRRYENAETQSRDKKLDRKANSRKNTFLHKRMEATTAQDLTAGGHRQLELGSPLSISYLFSENIQSSFLTVRKH